MPVPSICPLSRLRVLTWNTLAPCYFRQGGRIEADEPEMYLERHAHIARIISEVDADVVCLQEFWFDDALTRLYHEKLGENQYHILALQRTGLNWEGRSEDGVAVLLRRENLVVEKRRDVLFETYGIAQDRVGLLVVVRHVSLSAENGGHDSVGVGRRFGILCTHLTFPHSKYDEHSRGKQIAACLAAVEAEPELRAAAAEDALPVFVGGDLNGPASDIVGSTLRTAGFRSTWTGDDSEIPITHVDHRGTQMTSDHIYLRGSSLYPQSAEILPTTVPCSAALRRPVMGALASCGSDASAVQWSDLSDHRPLLISCDWVH
eukprot:TRINITY_DN67613_c0_g1_i1.p1 TRINITY_DN67613_c0_g1~~TRINITY_DN67613_c0_g1_i1.p1  ORF type:complete len:331 (-),score=31.42 TRINITY_DN67613_c0_g1_i1:28-984(-)